MSAAFDGLTWDHPRGYAALRAAAHDGDLINWNTQPLENFESASIAELCTCHDLVVLDHPHLGEAMAANCLQPLDDVFAVAELTSIENATVGASYASYNLGGKQWALPLDAASQVMALRGDLLKKTVPTTWDEVVALAERGFGLALSLAGPHALLSFLSIAAAIQPEDDLRNGDCWIDRAVAHEAWHILSVLAKHALVKTFNLNPIGLLEAMIRTDDITLCPLVYGYVNYADVRLTTRLTFADAPAIRGSGWPGSIIGGTGIAISRRCRINGDLRAHLLWLLSEEAQSSFIPNHAGQPSALSSWRDPGLNKAWNDFYTNTLNTLRHAHIRPRHDGFIGFQTAASDWLREALDQNHDATRTLDTLDTLFRNSHKSRSAR